MITELESVRSLPEQKRASVPDLNIRMHLPVGAQVRLLVLVDGVEHLAPDVVVTEVTDAGYVGHVIDDCVGGSPERRIPEGMRFEFTADHVIEY